MPRSVPALRRRLAALAVLLIAGSCAEPFAGEDQFLPPIPRKARPRSPGAVVYDTIQENLVRLPSQPLPCPVCRHTVNVVVFTKPGPDGRRVIDRDWGLTANDYDADLCPHPIGRVRFNADIPFCPYCGFAALATDFFDWQRRDKPFPADVAQWIRSDIEPEVRMAEQALVGVRGASETGESATEVTNRLMEVFAEQELIPDELRCESALLVYERLGAPGWLRAKMTWMAAWSHRRALLVPPDGPYMLQSLEAVLKALGLTQGDKRRVFASDIDIERQIAGLRDFIEKKREDGRPLHSYHQRTLSRILIAGLYNRLGYQNLARSLYQNVEKEMAQEFPHAPADPLWADTRTDNEIPAREREASVRRQSLLMLARSSLVHLDREALHLGNAGKLVRENLAAGAYNATPGQIPSHMFLVGEFARRVGDYPRAWVWLAAASQLVDSGPAPASGGLENFAPQQLDELKGFLELSKIPTPDFAKEVPLEEIRLANQLVETYRKKK